MEKINYIIRNLKKKLIYFTPRKYKQMMSQQIKYAGMKPTFVNRFLTFSLLFSTAFTIIVIFDMWVFGFPDIAIPVGLVGGFIIFAIIQVSVVLIADLTIFLP